MKTIIDAVNEFQGVWPTYEGLDVLAIAECIKVSGSHACGDMVDVVIGYDDRYYDEICRIEEFNAMVAEMSEGFEEYKREYEMDKTVTVDGMVYELGGLYKSQCGDIVGLLSVDMGRFTCVVLGGGRQSYGRITALTMDSLGAITPRTC